MTKRLGALALAALATTLSGCGSGSGSGFFTTTQTAPVTTSNTNATLQLAVGTLSDPSGLLGAPGTYLNAVTTFRNPTGTAAFFHPGSATLSGPGGLTLNLGQLFAYGQAAGVNYTLGEPPAFGTQNNVGGYSTGYIITGSAPTPGDYAAATTVSYNDQTVTFSAHATLPTSPTVLPAEPLPVWASDGKGGGTFTMTNPPGVTESLIYVQAGNGNYVATVELKSPSTTTTVPDGTLSVGVTYYVFCLGADYPLIESAGPNSSTVAAPPLTGSAGTADLTASTFTTFVE